MPLTVKALRGGKGYKVAGLHPSFEKLEKAIFAGKIPAPYTVEFKDKDGNVVAKKPLEVNAEGRPTKLTKAILGITSNGLDWS